MRKIKLFIACSLDGFIARPDGGIDWLFTEGDYGYQPFYASIDTTLMGYKTYETALNLGENYADKKNYVFTRKTDRIKNEYTTFISGNIVEFTKQLKTQPGKDIWLIGGGEITWLFYEHQLIDTYIIAIHPVILGQGIPLFSGLKNQQDLLLKDCKVFPNGLIQTFYEIKLLNKKC